MRERNKDMVDVIDSGGWGERWMNGRRRRAGTILVSVVR